MQRGQVEVEVSLVSHDHINHVSAAHSVDINVVHCRLDGGRRGRNGFIREVINLIAPPALRRCVNAANGAGCRCARHKVLEATDRLAVVFGVGVEQSRSHFVFERLFRVADFALNEVVLCSRAAVLGFFKTSDYDVGVQLFPLELGAGEHVRSGHVQRFQTGIPLDGSVLAVFEVFKDFHAARNGRRIALALHPLQERIVIQDVVVKLVRVCINRGGHDFSI